MGSSRKKYDGTFKRESVRLADSSGKNDRTDREGAWPVPGCNSALAGGAKADPGHAFPGTGHLKPLEDENRRLMRENAILREERDILKKAVAIFSKRPKTSIGL